MFIVNDQEIFKHLRNFIASKTVEKPENPLFKNVIKVTHSTNYVLLNFSNKVIITMIKYWILPISYSVING